MEQKSITAKILTLGVIAAAVAALAFGAFYLFKDTSGYQTTQAVVTGSRYAGSDDSGETYNVDYEYIVDGVRYNGSFSGSERDQPGDTLTVWYDPASPGNSYQSQGEANWLGGIGVLFGAGTLFAYVRAWLKKRHASRVTEAAPTQEPPVPPAA